MGQIIFFAVSAVGLVLLNWSDVKAFLPSVGKTGSIRAGAIAALDQVIVYFESQGCQEGVQAARECGPHFWHPHAADSTTKKA